MSDEAEKTKIIPISPTAYVEGDILHLRYGDREITLNLRVAESSLLQKLMKKIANYTHYCFRRLEKIHDIRCDYSIRMTYNESMLPVLIIEINGYWMLGSKAVHVLKMAQLLGDEKREELSLEQSGV